MAPTKALDPGVITFYATAGSYINSVLQQALVNLPKLPRHDGLSFLVQLGDWNTPYQTECAESEYKDVRELFAKSSIPVYFVVGDNESTGKKNPLAYILYWS